MERPDDDSTPALDDPHGIRVAAAYDRRAGEYIELLGRVDATSCRDRLAIESWADGIDGAILDAGCGPGQWTRHLAARREEPVVGLDLSARFLEEARARSPLLTFVEGDLGQMPFDDGAFDGVLAWFSTIHTPPADMPRVLGELARVTRAGGRIMLGFFAGTDREPFDHAVTTAYFWQAASLAHLLEAAGFAVERTVQRHEDGMRPQGEIVAVRV